MTKNTYYLYSHIDPVTNIRKYIGIGQYDRAWNTRRNQRKESHVLWLENLYKEGFTLSDIVKIERKGLSKREALFAENIIIKNEKPEFNELGNPDHWNRGRKYTNEIKEFVKTLHEMGYGYIRIAYLLGGNKTNHMTIKRMVTND